MIPFPYKQKLITSLATTVSCERNWIITPTSGQKRKYLSLQNNNYNKYGNVLKNWLCPNFLLLPKKSELPKIWGGCSSPRPPTCTPMVWQNICTNVSMIWLQLCLWHGAEKADCRELISRSVIYPIYPDSCGNRPVSTYFAMRRDDTLF